MKFLQAQSKGYLFFEKLKLEECVVNINYNPISTGFTIYQNHNSIIFLYIHLSLQKTNMNALLHSTKINHEKNIFTGNCMQFIICMQQ